MKNEVRKEKFRDQFLAVNNSDGKPVFKGTEKEVDEFIEKANFENPQS